MSAGDVVWVWVGRRSPCFHCEACTYERVVWTGVLVVTLRHPGDAFFEPMARAIGIEHASGDVLGCLIRGGP